MGRVSSTELETLRALPLVELVTRSGVALEKRGADFFGLCPFHDDREPSLVVSPEKNLWHCLGACQAGGSTIDWVMKSRKVSFRHAVEVLRTELGTAAPLEISTTERLPCPLSAEVDDAALLRQVVEYYHATLAESPDALAYLESRGLGSPELIATFQLGFVNRTLGLRLPIKAVRAGEVLRSRLLALGILRESGHEHFNGSVVLPIFDASGNVVEIYGRKITPNLRKGTAVHGYLPGPHAGVFNLEALRGSKELIVCEALLDALTFWAHGFRNVTSTFGAGVISEELLEACQAYAVERVLIAFDRDDAGDAGAEKLALRLAALGISCFRVLFPRGMDANEYALKVSPAVKSLDLVLRNAVPMGVSTRVSIESSTFEESSLKAYQVPLAAPLPPPAEATPPPALPSKLEREPRPRREGIDTPAVPPMSLPAAPAKVEVEAEVSDQEIVIWLGDRRYRVRGFARNLSYDSLKIQLLVGRGDNFFVDMLDLYSAKQRASYLKQAVEELGIKDEVLKKDLGKVLLKLEELQDAQIKKTLEPSKPQKKVVEGLARDRALELLRDPRLLDRILEDFRRCGVVGEETNKLVGYLATISRQAEQPLAVLIQSSSAAGKTSLMEAVLSFVPEEERVKYSAMTGQSLFYMSETNLKHKVLALVEEEGAERATYALKLLQSEGELTIASTGKDPHSGKLVTHEYRVEGPVAILLTTTSVEIDEELLNRCLVLTVDEGREQTRAIHREQRERRTLEGYLARQDRHEIRAIHQDAQRLLEPLPILNPWARRLDFVDGQTRTRRDNEKYLTLIDAIALLHQHQRARKEAVRRTGEKIEHLEVSLEDIEAANKLAHEILGHSLDELPPQTRRLLSLLDRWVSDQCGVLEIDRVDFRFTTKQVREVTGCGQTQLKTHMARLLELEYLIQHRAQRGQFYLYELVYDGGGEDGKPFVTRLLDVDKLREELRAGQSKSGLEPSKSGQNAAKSGRSRGEVGPKSAPSRGSDFEEKSFLENDLEDPEKKTSKKAYKAKSPENHVVLESAAATQRLEASP